MLSRVRNLTRRLIPKKIQKFIGRHFTWLSGTLIGFLIAIILGLVLLYVPGATANAFVGNMLSIGAGVVTIVTFLGALITISDYLEKKGVTNPASNSKGSDDKGLSSPAQGFVRTEKELMQEAMQALEGWFEIRSDGQIQFKNQGAEKKGDPKAMLYVFAARVAYEAEHRDSPKVSKDEIMDQIGFSTAAASVFISKMADFIIRNFDPDNPETYRNSDDSEIKVEINRKKAREAVEYIRGERRSPN